MKHAPGLYMSGCFVNNVITTPMFRVPLNMSDMQGLSFGEYEVYHVHVNFVASSAD